MQLTPKYYTFEFAEDSVPVGPKATGIDETRDGHGEESNPCVGCNDSAADRNGESEREGTASSLPSSAE
jgi:hypothetical protein